MNPGRFATRDTAVRVGVLIWLAAVWVALWGQISTANVLAGLVVGTLVTVILPLPRIPVRGRLRFVPLLKLVGVSVFYALQSSLQLAWFAIRPAPPPVAGVLRVQLAFKSDLALLLCVDLLNLFPGTMVLEIDRPQCVVYVHVIDVGSEEAVAGFYRSIRQVERLLIAGLQQPRATPLPTETSQEVTS